MNKNKTISTPIARNTVVDPKVSKEYIAFHDICTIQELNQKQIKIIHSKILEKEIGQKEKKNYYFSLLILQIQKHMKYYKTFIFSLKDFCKCGLLWL